MVSVIVTTLAVVSFALDSVSVNRDESLSASRKEEDASPSPPIYSVLVDPPAAQSLSAREEMDTTTPDPAFEDHDEMHESMDDAAEHNMHINAPVSNRSSVTEMQRFDRADDAADTQEVPYYFFNFPISIKFTGTSGEESTIVILDRFEVVPVPTKFVYIYPIVLFLGYTFIWAICCMRSNRTGLSFRLICEAAACFMCLWADLATKHKVITATRAWSYIIMMVLLLTGWNVASMVTHGTENEPMVFYVFQSLVALAWMMYSVERMFVRKYYRRTVDPMAGDHYCADCAANVCCGQFTALQEAQFMAEVSVEDTLSKAPKDDKPNKLTGGKDKW